MGLFFSGFLLSLSVCFDLGTVNIAMFRTGLQRGMWPAFWLGLGSCFGDLVYAGLSALAIGVVLQFALVRWALWIVGTLILLYLAYKMLRESMHAPLELDPAGTVPNQGEMLRLMRRGMALALSSPSALLWFATVGGSIIAAQTAQTQAAQTQAAQTQAIVPFFAGFFVAGVGFSWFIAFLAGQGRRRLSPQLLRGFTLASALLFLYFAVKVFVDGYHSVVI